MQSAEVELIVETDRGGVEASAIVPDHWQQFYAATGVPAALRVGPTLHVTGHDGEEADHAYPPDVETQIRRTFLVLGETLDEAGACWADVVDLRSFHVGLRAQSGILLAVAEEFMTLPFPAWTAVGVAQLYDDGALVEIACTAIIRTRIEGDREDEADSR